MGKLIPLNIATRLDVDPNRVLSEAIGKMEGVVLMGWDTEGEIYLASSYADGGTVLWLVEQLKRKLLDY
jgi:hypothetical protein